VNAPSLEVLALQLEQIQRQINAITGHVTARDDMPIASEGRLRVHLNYAEHAVTHAWSVLRVAANDAAKQRAAELEQVNVRA
jgi:hypothetical protein